MTYMCRTCAICVQVECIDNLRAVNSYKSEVHSNGKADIVRPRQADQKPSVQHVQFEVEPYSCEFESGLHPYTRERKMELRLTCPSTPLFQEAGKEDVCHRVAHTDDMLFFAQDKEVTRHGHPEEPYQGRQQGDVGRPAMALCPKPYIFLS